MYSATPHRGRGLSDRFTQRRPGRKKKIKKAVPLTQQDGGTGRAESERRRMKPQTRQPLASQKTVFSAKSESEPRWRRALFNGQRVSSTAGGRQPKAFPSQLVERRYPRELCGEQSVPVTETDTDPNQFCFDCKQTSNTCYGGVCVSGKGYLVRAACRVSGLCTSHRSRRPVAVFFFYFFLATLDFRRKDLPPRGKFTWPSYALKMGRVSDWFTNRVAFPSFPRTNAPCLCSQTFLRRRG